MRILYCNKYNFRFSGTEAYLFDLMALIKEQGHEVALFSMADSRGEPTKYDEHFLPHIDFKDAKRTSWNRATLAAHAIYSRDARRRIGRMVEEFQPDVAHVRNIYHHLSPSILWELKRRRVPVIYHLNDFKMLCPSYNMVSGKNACERCRGGQFWRVITEGCYAGGVAQRAFLASEAYFHRWMRTYQRCVDKFLVPSQFVQQKLVESGWDEKTIEVLPHFQRVPDQPLRAPQEDAGILYFGRLSAEKGVADLLHAMRSLPQVNLKVAGDGPIRGELEGLSADLGLRNVTFLGHVRGPALDDLISESRFTVLPSRAYETLGKTILESHAHGRAVVASDLGSRREFVRDGETGLLYRAGDVADLTENLLLLWEHPDLAAQMGEAGRAFVRRNYSPESHYQSIVSLYSQMAVKNAAKGRDSGPPDTPGEHGRRVRVAFIGARGVVGKYSGIEGYYEQAGRRLANAGHDVTIYCRSYFTPPREQYNGMRLVRLPTIRSKHLETAVHTLLSSVHVLFQRCDIVHYHALGPSLFSFLPRLVGKKTVVTVQGLDWQRKKWGPFARQMLRLGEKAAVRLPNKTMVVSRTLQSYYRNHYGAETIYIPNGAPLLELQPIEQIRNWGIEPGKYILFLGRFSPEKNCHLLVEAFERLNTEMKLVLAGGASPSDEYGRELRRHAGQQIHFLDYVSGTPLEELLSNAMIFVLPSDMEGLSLALLEAMGAGLCVLASDIPENHELVEGAGFLFKPADVTDLERMLRFLISDSAAREWAGEQAKRRIQARYLWPDITKEVERVYFDVMGWESAPTGLTVQENPLPGRRPAASEDQKGQSSPRRRAG